MKKATFLVLFLLLLLLTVCEIYTGRTYQIKGTIIKIVNDQEFETDLKTQLIFWKNRKVSGKIGKESAYTDYYIGHKWYFVGHTIPDSLQDKDVVIDYKPIDTQRGLFFAIKAELAPKVNAITK